MSESGNASPGRLAGQRLGLAAIGMAVLAFALWAMAAPLEGAIIAQGMVKPMTNRKAVQHAEGGIVKSLFARNGTQVAAGEPLLELEDVRTDSNAALLREMLAFETAKHARLAAEMMMSARFDSDAQLRNQFDARLQAAALERESRIFKVRRTLLDEQQSVLQRQQDSTASEQQSLRQQLDASRAAARLAQEELRINEGLLTEGYVTRARLVALERSVADANAKQAEHGAMLAQSEQRRNEIALRLASARSEYQRVASEEFKESSARLVQIREQLRPNDDALERKLIRAPAAGWVVGIKLNGPGELAQPRDVLMEIVPLVDKLIVEARVGVDAIGHLKLGQPAKLRFTTFNSRVTPMVDGSLSYIAADAVVDKDGVPSFVIQIEAEPRSIAQAAIPSLKPGMAAEVYVTTQPRRIVHYLLAPITDTLSRSMREP
jgi:HlyD family type I secretion membrane fusion protein